LPSAARMAKARTGTANVARTCTFVCRWGQCARTPRPTRHYGISSRTMSTLSRPTGGVAGRGIPTLRRRLIRRHGRRRRALRGEERWLLMELKLLADVGLLGFPNAGKSTLLAHISAARPKIADYPFTTLTPHLGVVQLPDYATCVVADIPGLIPGAHAGRGLGLDFLKHIERTCLLVHLVDLSTQEEGRSPGTDFEALHHELACFSPELAQRPQIVVATKMDLPIAQQRWPDVQRLFSAHGYEILSISAATGEGVQALICRLAAYLQHL